MNEGAEMTFAQFIESKWFKGGARAAMFFTAAVVSVGGSVFAWAVLTTKSDVATVTTTVVALEENIGTVAAALDLRDADQERFQTAVDKSFGRIDTKVSSLDDSVDAMAQDVATMKGILMQMQGNVDVAASRPLIGLKEF